jgi:hypothetical protein
MDIIFCKSWWEMMREPAEVFLDRVAADGFHASELFVPAVDEKPATIRSWHEQRGLRMVGQFITVGDTPAEHLDSLERRFASCVEAGAMLVNGHIGRDIFPLADNLVLAERGCALAEAAGIALCHETHRSRPTFSTMGTAELLGNVPDMRLTLDISHWVCVHEGLLAGHEPWLEPAFAATRHVHARIGHGEGPQVSHPLAPEWANERTQHLAWWQGIVDRRQAAGAPWLTITPEFGPRAYMPTLPFTNTPVADAWTVNVEVYRWLSEALVIH